GAGGGHGQRFWFNRASVSTVLPVIAFEGRSGKWRGARPGTAHGAMHLGVGALPVQFVLLSVHLLILVLSSTKPDFCGRYSGALGPNASRQPRWAGGS